MMSLPAELSAIVGRAFEAEGFAPSFGTVQASDRPDLAQFQCNGALGAAKQAKTNPRALADKVVLRLKADPLFAKVEIAGPGFINLDITDAALTERVRAMTADGRLGAPETGKGRKLVIDFGGPNVAKPMHVGHLRSAIIGDSLQRLYRANGWDVTSDVHLGDWGLQMGQLISEIGRRGTAPIYFDANYTGPYPETSPVTMDDLEEIYPAALSGLQGRPGTARRSARGDGGIAGRASRLSRPVAAFLHGFGSRPQSRICEPRRQLRPVEGRGGCRSADRAHGRGPQGEGARGDERRRARHSGCRADATRRKCRR